MGDALDLARLRRPDGCPWDREQTHASLRKHLLEEAYEVYDALEAGATPDLAEELGDLLLQIILHAQLAAEAGVFDLADVQAAIATKIVRRHPHVFGDAVARTACDVNRQWERIKADERAAAADASRRRRRPADARTGWAAVPRPHAEERAGRDQPVAAGAGRQPGDAGAGRQPRLRLAVDRRRPRQGGRGGRGAARAATTPSEARSSATSLFVLVNVARRQGIEAEAAIRAANAKFRRRFASVERQAADQGVALRDLDFDALDALWDTAKAEERTT